MDDTRPTVFSRSAVALASVGLFLVTALSACGGGATTFSPGRPAAALPAAIAKGCVYPSTSTTSTALPAAGGVTGSISIGAVAQASTACSAIVVATGSDSTLSASVGSIMSVRTRRTAMATTAETPPLLQVSLTNAYTGSLPWLSLTLDVPPLSVPPGSYPATITAPGEDGQLITQEYTITVGATGTVVVTPPPTGSVLVTLGAGATGVLSIYPMGTTFPTPSPSGSATPSPVPTSTATSAPTATPSVAPTTAPKPTQSPSGTASISISPSACIDAGSNGATLNYTAKAVGGPVLPAGASYRFGWFAAATQPAFGLTVQPPSAPYAGTNVIVGGPAATVTVPAFGSTGLTGESGAIQVYLFLSQNGGLGYVEQPSGAKVVASAVIAAGAVTCAGLGL